MALNAHDSGSKESSSSSLDSSEQNVHVFQPVPESSTSAKYLSHQDIINLSPKVVLSKDLLSSKLSDFSESDQKNLFIDLFLKELSFFDEKHKDVIDSCNHESIGGHPASVENKQKLPTIKKERKRIIDKHANLLLELTKQHTKTYKKPMDKVKEIQFTDFVRFCHENEYIYADDFREVDHEDLFLQSFKTLKSISHLQFSKIDLFINICSVMKKIAPGRKSDSIDMFKKEIYNDLHEGK